MKTVPRAVRNEVMGMIVDRGWVEVSALLEGPACVYSDWVKRLAAARHQCSVRRVDVCCRPAPLAGQAVLGTAGARCNVARLLCAIDIFALSSATRRLR